MLTFSELAEFIHKHDIQAELVHLSTKTPTVHSAAQALGVSQDQILKSVLFLVKDQPVLVIGIGPVKIDRRPIADYFGVGKKKVTLADPETVLKITGYPVGTLPPFGHRTRIETLLDRWILREEEVYAGGGAIDRMMRVSTADLIRITQASVLALQDHHQEGSAYSPPPSEG